MQKNYLKEEIQELIYDQGVINEETSHAEISAFARKYEKNL